MGAGITESEEFQGEELIDDLICLQGSPGTDIHCTGGPIEIAIGS